MECERGRELCSRIELSFPRRRSSFAHITTGRSRVVFSVKVSTCACEGGREPLLFVRPFRNPFFGPVQVLEQDLAHYVKGRD